MRLRVWAQAAATLAAMLLVPSLAQAYCRTMACSKTDPDLMCTFDENECPVNNLPLYWPTSCISFGVQKGASPLRHIDYDLAHQIVVDSFNAWKSADCGGGTRPSIEIVDYGRISCSKREYNSDQPNANVIMFRDDRWPYENAIDTLALTTITFNVDSGEIYDADIEVNSFQAELTIDEGAAVADLPSIMTHEVGHFLGLGHSPVRAATMRPGYNPGDIGLRTLDADDVAGICAIYAPNRALPPAECTPRHGFSGQCATEDEGCTTTTPGRTQGPSTVAWLGLLLGFSAWRRARRRPGRAVRALARNPE